MLKSQNVQGDQCPGVRQPGSLDDTMDSITSEVERVEDLLLLAEFEDAVDAAQAMLQRRRSVLSESETGRAVEGRVWFVLLQALFESKRHSESLPALLEYFGSASSTPSHVVLLWAALSLEDDEDCSNVLAEFLEAVTVDGGVYSVGGDTLSDEMYEGLVRMYAIEVLAKGTDSIAAQGWLDSTACLLQPAARQAVRSELQQQLEQAGTGAGDASPRRPAGAAAAGASTVTASAPTTPADTAHQPAPSAGAGQQGQGGAGRAASRAGSSCSTDSGGSGSSAIQRSLGGGPGPGCWLVPCSAAAPAAACGGEHAAHGPGPVQQGAWLPMGSAAQAAGVVAAGALVAYAAYAERQPLKRAAQRAVQGIQRGLADTAAMAFGVAVNPIATATSRIQSRL